MSTVTEHTMDTLAARFGNKHAVYYGARGHWLTLYGQTRDSDPQERANFDTLCEDMSARFPQDVAIERASHWLVGWVEYLVVNPDNRAARDAYLTWRNRLAEDDNLNPDLAKEYQREEDESWLKLESPDYSVPWLVDHRGHTEESARKYLEDIGVDLDWWES